MSFSRLVSVYPKTSTTLAWQKTIVSNEVTGTLLLVGVSSSLAGEFLQQWWIAQQSSQPSKTNSSVFIFSQQDVPYFYTRSCFEQSFVIKISFGLCAEFTLPCNRWLEWLSSVGGAASILMSTIAVLLTVLSYLWRNCFSSASKAETSAHDQPHLAEAIPMSTSPQTPV